MPLEPKNPKRPRDPNQWAKRTTDIVSRHESERVEASELHGLKRLYELLRRLRDGVFPLPRHRSPILGPEAPCPRAALLLIWCSRFLSRAFVRYGSIPSR